MFQCYIKRKVRFITIILLHQSSISFHYRKKEIRKPVNILYKLYLAIFIKVDKNLVNGKCIYKVMNKHSLMYIIVSFSDKSVTYKSIYMQDISLNSQIRIIQLNNFISFSNSFTELIFFEARKNLITMTKYVLNQIMGKTEIFCQSWSN